MSVLNLRNVPEDLHMRLRISAARAGQPLHAHCLHLLGSAVGAGQITGSPPAWREPLTEEKPAVPSAQDEAVPTRGATIT